MVVKYHIRFLMMKYYSRAWASYLIPIFHQFLFVSKQYLRILELHRMTLKIGNCLSLDFCWWFLLLSHEVFLWSLLLEQQLHAERSDEEKPSQRQLAGRTTRALWCVHAGNGCGLTTAALMLLLNVVVPQRELWRDY